MTLKARPECEGWWCPMCTAQVMAAIAADAISGRTLLALAPLVLLLVGLMAYCLMDLARAPSVRYLPKPVWALIIVLVSFPLGAIAYLVLGKDHHDRQDSLPRDSLPQDHDKPSARSWNATG